MKKAITIIFLFVSVLGFSQAKKDSVPPAPVQPVVVLKFTPHDLQILYDDLDQSAGNHMEIVAILRYILQEYKKQITDSTGKK